MSDKPPYDHARIVRLHKSGVPSSHIARRLGCSRRMVNRVIREEARRAADGT